MVAEIVRWQDNLPSPYAGLRGTSSLEDSLDDLWVIITVSMLSIKSHLVNNSFSTNFFKLIIV